MKANIALLLCICLQLACSMDLEEIPPREVMITENSTKHEPVISNPAKTITRTSGTDRWRLDVPGHFVDVVFKSSGGGANQQIALVREFQQDESIPTLSKDFHPDHRPVSHYQLYVQNSTNSSSTRRPVGAPFEGHCRIGHTYYMDSEVGDYILSSALQFSEPESVIRMFLTWTDLDIRKQIYHLSYNLERDCRVHDFTTSTSGGSFVSSLPNYDCPWAAAVPSPDGTLIALMHHGSSPVESYKVDVEVLIASHDYTPSLFKNRLIFDNVQFEEAIFYHWVDTNRFRIYGGSSAYEISADNFSVLLIPFDRKARSLQKTSSCRVSNDGSTVLVLDRENGNEPRSLPNRHEKPFGIAHP